jgi:hypothetical protein
VRVEPLNTASLYNPQDPLIAAIVVENNRPVMAHIDARKSCLIDPEQGAANLFLVDRVLPPSGWLRIRNVLPSYMTVNLLWGPYVVDSPAGQPHPLGARQRILLNFAWEDGVTETVDCSFEIQPVEETHVTSEGG